MATIDVRLEGILLDPDQDIDLVSLPEEEAAVVLLEHYAFAGEPLTVEIAGGRATITFPDPDPGAVRDAWAAMAQAERLARKRRFPQAIKLLKDVVAAAPAFVQARRCLATLYREHGQHRQAAEQLAVAARLAPRDRKVSLLLLALYVHDSTYDRVNRVLARALALAPDDPELLAKAGTVKAVTGEPEQAERLYEQALALDPLQELATVGLARVWSAQNRPQEAIRLLEDYQALFATEHSAMIAGEEIRAAHDQAAATAAFGSFARLMEIVRERQREIEAAGGVPVAIIELSDLDPPIHLDLAWTAGREDHRILYNGDLPGYIVPHHILRHLEIIAIITEGRLAGSYQHYVVTAAAHERIRESVPAHQRRSFTTSEEEAEDSRYRLDVIAGIIDELIAVIRDMIIERRIFARFPEMALLPAGVGAPGIRRRSGIGY